MSEIKEETILDLEADINEFKSLLKDHATRPNVKSVLEGWIQKCESEKTKLDLVFKTQGPKPITKEEEAKKPDWNPMDQALKQINDMQFSPIEKYGWDQADKKVKIYITSGIDGIGQSVKDKKTEVSCEFTDDSLDL